MRVPYDEDMASHIGPESCVGIRKGVGEALTGESAGQVLSRDRKRSGVPTMSLQSEGNTGHPAIARDGLTPRGLRPWARMEVLCTGTGRSRARPGMALRSAPSIHQEYCGDVRVWEVGQVHSTWEASEQGYRCADVCGGSGGKGPDQGEFATTQQVPDSVPGKGYEHGQP
jgi:hypothetical protein